MNSVLTHLNFNIYCFVLLIYEVSIVLNIFLNFQGKALYSLASIHNTVDVDCEYTLLNPNPHFKTVGSAIITTNVTLDREENSYHKVRLELNIRLVLIYST